MVSDPVPLFFHRAPPAANWLSIGFQDISLKGGPLGEPKAPETVVIYITGTATHDQNGNDRSIESQRGGSKPALDPDIQVCIQRRSRPGRHTTQDGSHTSPSPASSMA